MEHPYWPPFGLRLRTPRLEMRVYQEADVPALIDAAGHGKGIHDPSFMPFGIPWTDAESPEFEREFYRHYWRSRAFFAPDKWGLPFMVEADGEPVGVQDLRGDEFPALRTIWSGSWLRRDRQGQGLGKEMRLAILALAFDGLGAEVATSESFVDNHSSIGVSQGLGYEENGLGRLAPRGEPREAIRWRLTRERFAEVRSAGHYAEWEPVEIEGLDPCLPVLGLA